jgi:Uma2 family endonuclease
MRLDRVRKRPIYAREAVAHAWLVDPLARSLEVFRRQGEHWVLISTHADDERVRAEPFDEVELELGALWIAATAPEGDPDK